jgi:hypothetical protein
MTRLFNDRIINDFLGEKLLRAYESISKSDLYSDNEQEWVERLLEMHTLPFIEINWNSCKAIEPVRIGKALPNINLGHDPDVMVNTATIEYVVDHNLDPLDIFYCIPARQYFDIEGMWEHSVDPHHLHFFITTYSPTKFLSPEAHADVLAKKEKLRREMDANVASLNNSINNYNQDLRSFLTSTVAQRKSESERIDELLKSL